MFISKKDYNLMCNRNEDLRNEKDEIKEKLRITENNELLLLKENSLIKNIAKQIIYISESNTYGNAELNLRKIKELASTAINH